MKVMSDLGRNDKYLLFVLFFVLILRIIVLGAYPLMDTTEARYGEIAREMVATNNWITPQLDPGSPFWGKPPLSFWVTAISFKLFGISEFTARFPSLLFALGNMFFIFILARTLVNSNFALRACVVLATTGLFYFMAGGVMTDPSLSFSVTISMVSFLLALKDRISRLKHYWKYLFFIGLGLSLLSKGPIGIVLTCFPLLVWVIYKNKWNEVNKSFSLGIGVFLTLAISLPWHILAEIKTPGFLEYYFIGEHFKRFVIAGWQGDLYGSAHAQPRGMIWLFLIPTTLPWIIYFIANIQSIVREKKIIECISSQDWVSYLIFWFLSPLLFFSLSGNILMTYVLPGLPAFAILTVYLIWFNKKVNIARKNKWYTSSKTFAAFSLFLPLLYTVVSFTILPKVGVRRSHKLIGQTFNQDSSGSARLIYTRKMPYSADFYSKGKGVSLKKELDFNEMSKYLTDDNRDYYVIYKDDEGRIPDRINSMITKVNDFGKYSLFQEI